MKMSKVRITSFILSLILVLSIILSTGTVFAENNKLLVSEEDATKATKQFVNLHPGLKGSEINKIIPVYDVDNNLELYFVELIKYGNPYAILGVGATVGNPTGVYIGIYFGYDDPFEYHNMAAYGYYENTNLGYREIEVATGWGYPSSFDYDYYRSRYAIHFMPVIE